MSDGLSQIATDRGLGGSVRSHTVRTPGEPKPGRTLAVRRLASELRNTRSRRRLARGSELVAPAHTERIREPDLPPVFVLSAGWRSGSTAVQRLVVSGGDAFIWGEPYPTARLLPRLHRIAVEAPVVDGQQKRVLEPDDIASDLWASWLATTNPAPSYLLAAIRRMLEELYWRPLQNTRFRTWGTKEVVATPAHISLLQHLFPDAHFVCVVRDPLAAYRSFRRYVVSGPTMSDRPSARLTFTRSPAGYARIWRTMAAQFRAMISAPGVHVFRYEDINDADTFPGELSERLGMTLNPAAWATRVGSVATMPEGVVGRAELAVVRALTRDEARHWGYAGN